MKLKQKLIILFLLAVPAIALAQTCPPGRTCLTNPLGFLGIVTPEQLIIKATQGFAMIMGTVAVAFLVFSAFKLIIATNEEAIKSSREAITWSVSGFALSILAFTIISGTAALLGFRSVAQDDKLDPCGFLRISQDCAKNRDFTQVVISVMTQILGLVGIVAVMMIIYHGYRYITAAGNEEGIAAAKSGLRWSIIGLIIIMLAFTIIAGLQRIFFSI